MVINADPLLYPIHSPKVQAKTVKQSQKSNNGESRSRYHGNWEPGFGDGNVRLGAVGRADDCLLRRERGAGTRVERTIDGC
jgi:hypothetical protein